MTPRRILASAVRRLRCATLPSIASLAEIPALAGPGIRAVSFDCFDTLVHRIWDPPEMPLRRWATLVADACAAMGRPMTETGILAERARTADRLRGGHASGEYRLSELHAALAQILGLDTELLLRCEIQAERSALVAAPGAAEVLARLRGSGLRIAVVSDMYLDEALLRGLLQDLGILEPADLLLVSGERQASKAAGGLFDILLAGLGLPASAVLHVGDHHLADAIMPRRRGIAAFWLHDRPDLARRRRCRRITSLEPGWLDAFDAQTGPAAVPPEARPAAFAIGYGIIGPALTLAVHRILDQVGRDAAGGPATIGFMARDGWLLHRIAERLIAGDPRLAALMAKVRPAYLHMSRRAVWPVSGDDPQAIIRGLAEGLSVHGTFRAVARLLALGEQDIDEVLGDCPHLDAPIRGIADPARELDLWFGRASVLDRIRTRRSEAGTGLKGYLAGHGIYGRPEAPLHLVDLGWFSSIQIALAKGLADDPAMPDVVGHLVGNGRGAVPLAPGGRSRLAEGGLVDARHPTAEDAIVFRAIGMLEIACQTDEGSTLGYHRQDGRWVPVAGDARAVDAGFRRDLQAGVFARVDAMLPLLASGVRFEHRSLQDARRRIARFITAPTRDEAMAFATTWFDVDVGTNARIPCIGRDLSWRDLAPPSRMMRKIRGVAWVEGSIAASGFVGGRWLHRGWLAARALQNRLRRR
ncbi:MAG: hypothetical protein RLZZ127_2363 [Planctomycetota bacterium]